LKHIEEIEKVILKIKELINTRGYIYALCIILFEDFNIDPETTHEVNYIERFNVKEASFLLGLLIQNKISLSPPESPQVLMQLKQKTYNLMKKLHESFMILFNDKLEKSVGEEYKKENFRKAQKEFFGQGSMMVEPIFYSGTGAFDVQYLEFLEKKYKYDENWLYNVKNFEFSEIKNILQKKLINFDYKSSYKDLIRLTAQL